MVKVIIFIVVVVGDTIIHLLIFCFIMVGGGDVCVRVVESSSSISRSCSRSSMNSLMLRCVYVFYDFPGPEPVGGGATTAGRFRCRFPCRQGGKM